MTSWTARRLGAVVTVVGAMGICSAIGVSSLGHDAVAAVAHGTSADTRSVTTEPVVDASILSNRVPTSEIAPPEQPAACVSGKAQRQDPAYGWPVKPFHRQHPVRGYFGDPRIGQTEHGLSRSFHFGVDVSAPDGTAVFATISGRAQIPASHSDTVTITAPDGTEFEYWHVVANVRSGDYVTAYRTQIGRIEKPWAHVHFAERRNGAYLNPLRPGAMGPYADGTCPAIREVRFEHEGVEQRNRNVHGTPDVVVGAYDMPAMPVTTPKWTGLPVTPVLVQWRIVGANGRVVSPWANAFDVRTALPTVSYYSLYAVGTRQNRPNRPGKYRFYLAHAWHSFDLKNGQYTVQVLATDSAGNHVRYASRFVVSN